MNETGLLLALVDIDRSTEFTGDDVDQYSKLVDLGLVYKDVQVFIPTITSSTVSLAIQTDKYIAEVPTLLQAWKGTEAASYAQATTAGTTACVITFKDANAQYVRIKCGSNQAADRNFYVRGC